MGDIGREYLRESERIVLSPGEPGKSGPEEDDAALIREEFEIGPVIGEGTSAVCYKAFRIRYGHRKAGTLKELYPIEGTGRMPRGNYRMVRDKRSRQLSADGEDPEGFLRRRDDYLKAYRKASGLTEEVGREYFANFVQVGDVYHGIGDSDRATVYIWTSENIGIDMEQYLERIRKYPGKNPESKLNDILKIVKTLTCRIQELHKFGYMHLDIKPSNLLLVYQGENTINPEQVVLSDIDSLHKIGTEEDYSMAGSKGYRAPELEEGKPNNQSDIYSIGALLFRAIVIDDNLEYDGRYCDDYYRYIPVMVENSKLIARSVMNSDDQLMGMLAYILKNCLAKDRRNRYQSCASLLKDLNEVVSRTNVTDKMRKRAEEIQLGDAEIAIQKLLYDRPLYTALPNIPEEGKNIDIRVLVVGCGTYGQKFMDFCLQAGQMRGYSVAIKAISKKSRKDYSNYTQFRPDIKRFVNIYAPRSGENSKGKIERSCYGTIHFEPVKGADGETEFKNVDGNEISPENKEIISYIVQQAENQNKGFHYIFVALGEDELNRQVAQAFADEMKKLSVENLCPVGFVWEGAKRPDGSDGYDAPVPVLINRSLKPSSIDTDLEQMAFNTDLVWSGESYENIDKKKQEFCSDAYRYSSSLAYVLSLKYKLYSLGISLEGGRAQAAREFSDNILSRVETDEKARKDYNMLAWLEHRRWVLDRAAEGWQAPRDRDGNLDLEGCVENGMVKNPIHRTHPCMVPSSPEPALMGKGYTEDDRSNWENSDLTGLDDLDKMSVQLHQRFRRKADEIIFGDPLYTGNMEKIQNLIINLGEGVNRGFAQFRFCLKNILEGVESYAGRYSIYKKQFQNLLRDISEGDRQMITDLLKKVDKEFFPVIEANLYRDYKKNDVDLVRKIPYILTFRPVSGIAMAFEEGLPKNGRNEAVFADVASVSVLCPRNIYYLYRFTGSKSGELLADKLSAVLSYLNQRRMSCAVSLKILCAEDVEAGERDNLNIRLEELIGEGKREEANAVLEEYWIDDCPDSAEAAKNFGKFLKEILENQPGILYDAGTSLFASDRENENFIQNIREIGMPCFAFDWRKKKFTIHEGCDHLQYIEDGSCLGVEEMFSLAQAEYHRSSLPEFMDDYEALWKAYTTNAGGSGSNGFSDSVMTWNSLCECLGDYERNREPLAEIRIDPEQNHDRQDMIYELPRHTSRTVNRILKQLIEFGFVDQDSSLVSHTSENNRLIVKADAIWKKVFDKVFAEPWYLQDYYDVQMIVTGDHDKVIRFTFNSMDIKCLDLNPEGKKRRNNGLYELLVKLQEQGYIRSLKREGDKDRIVSFSYSSPMIKDLLTSSGRILVIYAYYEALKTGYFDDIATGCEFLRNGRSVKDELDLVLTKGFRSLFVECGTRKNPECGSGYYIESLAEDIGIGTISVALGNDDIQSRESRGIKLNIKTITDKDSIENIGQTLISVMKEQQ